MGLGQFTGAVSFAAELTKDVDISASILDAQQCVPTLYDSSYNVVNIQITAISGSVLRITSEVPLTGTYHLVVIGAAPAATPVTPTVSATTSAPTLKRHWTYAQARDKLQVDLDLLDETFVTPNELIGYFNEGIEEAEGEILKVDEDYFLTSMPVPMKVGQSQYDYPENIIAYKERGIIYANGPVIYEVKKFRRNKKFETMAFALQYGQADTYRWFHSNDAAGAAKINLIPAAKEDAVVPPNPASFTPMTFWYIRHANRIPLIGEYVFNWEIITPDALDFPTGHFAISGTYATGDKVKLRTTSALPTGLSPDTEYFIIKGNGYIQFATTLQNAKTNTPIAILAQGVGLMKIDICATQAIVDATVLDLPEFTKFVIQWAKCRCMEKEGDPRLAGASAVLTQQREQMVSTLTEIQQDDDNTVEADFSLYREMS